MPGSRPLLLVRLACVGTLCACSDDKPELSPAAAAQLQAQADPKTWEDDPAHPRARLRDPRTGVVFVRVPAGEFTMGGTEVPEEQPPHRVRISRDYLLAETEVTVAQWRRYVQEHAGDPTVPVPAGDDLPMPAGFADAQAFCARYGYRLPSEAEWERACRGGLPPEQEPWRDPSGLARFAWFHLDAGQHAHAVRTREPNAYGLYDMLGNLWEWCADWYSPRAYKDLPDPAVDPQGAPSGSGHVLRGGSFYTLPGPMPETRTSDEEGGARNAFFGFRPARSLE